MNVLLRLILSTLSLIYSLNFIRTEIDVCKSQFYPTDPDVDKSVCELVVSAGFRCETYQVITKDGYILALFRVVNPAIKSVGKPVLLVHGLLANAAYFIVNSPGNGTQFSSDRFNGQPVSNNLGYALAMNGYDVWLISYRGDQHSMKHIILNPKLRLFWEFSGDERFKFDIPAIIDFIRTKNKSPKMSYVGHSQGTTIMFGLLSAFPTYNDIIDVAVGLAPVGRLRNSPSPYIQMAVKPPWPQMGYFTGGPVPNGFEFNSNLLSNLSRDCVFFNTAFLPFMFGLITGPSSQLNKSRAHVYFKNVGGESMWSMVRYGQHLDSIKYFDYGPVKNLLKYRSLAPPDYDLTKITSKVCLFSGTNDYLVSPKDLDFIRKQLNQKVLVCDYVEKALNHLDFGFGSRMSSINLRILQVFAKYK